MYYFIASLIVIANAALSISHFFKTERSAKIVKYASVSLAAIGAAVLAYVIISLKISLNSSALTEDTVLWAEDMYFLYLRWVLIFTAVIGASVILSSFIQPKRKKLRAAVCFLSSLIILLTCPMYSFMTENTSVNLAGYVLLTGIAFSLIFPFFRFADIAHIRGKGKKEKEPQAK